MGKTKTKEKFIQELKEILPNVKVIGEYINTMTNIKCKCLIHNEIFESTPINMLHGYTGCKSCKIEHVSKAKRKSHEQFVEYVKKINPDIEVIGKYINTSTYVRCRCTIDGYEWDVDPNKLLKKKLQCSVCRNHVVVPGVNDIATIHPELVKFFANPIDATKYVAGSESNADFICPECGTLKTMRISNFMRFGLGCNGCYKIKYGRSRAPYKYWNKDTMQKYLDQNLPGYIILDVKSEKEKSGWTLFVYIKCPNEDHDPYWARWANIQKGYLCQECAGNYSNGEKMAENIFNKYNIEFDPQHIWDDCRDMRPLPFDFYLRDYNLVVEIMGRQHEIPADIFGGQETFEYTVRHDKMKRDYLKKHGIDILDIWYYDFRNMEKIILNKIQSILNNTKLLDTPEKEAI